jgi:hypothetical protein
MLDSSEITDIVILEFCKSLMENASRTITSSPLQAKGVPIQILFTACAWYNCFYSLKPLQTIFIHHEKISSVCHLLLEHVTCINPEISSPTRWYWSVCKIKGAQRLWRAEFIERMHKLSDRKQVHLNLLPLIYL